MSDEKKSAEEIVKALENELSKSRQYWTETINDLSEKIRGDLKECTSLEAESISRQQELNEEVAKWSYKIYNDNARLKVLQKQKFEWYSTQYQIKHNSTEKAKLIEADLAWYTAKIEVLENYVEYLIETRKTMDHIIWSVKNKLQLYNLTGMDG